VIGKALVLALSFLAVAMTPAQQVFHSFTDAVRVDVLATDGRQPIDGLTTGDFELTDSGVRQKIDDIQIAEIPFNMMLTLDTSGSMAGPPLKQLQEGARAAIAALKDADRAAIVSFSDMLARPAPWTADKTALFGAVDQLRAQGSTSLFDAALASLVLRETDSNRRHLVILFTDGIDTSSWLPDFAALDLALRTEVVVYSVTTCGLVAVCRPPPQLNLRSGIRLASKQPVISSQDFLQELASRTGGESLDTSLGNLRKTFEYIVTHFRSRYVLSYAPQGVARAGWHPIEVKLTRRSGKVTARRGYER
jgi:VWFA-related protein